MKIRVSLAAFLLFSVASLPAQILIDGRGGFGFSYGTYEKDGMSATGQEANTECGGMVTLFVPVGPYDGDGDGGIHLGLSSGAFWGFDRSESRGSPFYRLELDCLRIPIMATLGWYSERGVLYLSGGAYFSALDGGFRQWGDDWMDAKKTWLPAGSVPGDYGIKLDAGVAVSPFAYDDTGYPAIFGLSGGFYFEFSLANRVSLPGERATTWRWGVWLGMPIFI